MPEVFDFPRDIQPILDRHCVECHNPDRYEGQGRPDRRQDGHVHDELHDDAPRGLVSDGRNRPESNSTPTTIGSSASRLMTLVDGSTTERGPRATK